VLSKAKVLILNDNPKYLIDTLPYYGYEVSGCGQELNSIKNNRYDIVILGENINNVNCLNILREIRAISGIPVIILAESSDEKKMVINLQNGADDYICPPFYLPNLTARMEAVLRRTKYNTFAKDVKSKKINKINTLTKREKDVLLLVTNGESNKAIADKLTLSEVTVKSHMSSIFRKLNVTNRTQAVLKMKQSEITR